MVAAARVTFGGRREPADRAVVGDNLEALATMADASVDFVYIDPPFATGQTRRGRGNRASYSDPGLDPQAFTEWLGPRLGRTRDLLSPTGSLFVHLDSRTVHYVKVALDGIFGRAAFVNEIIWCYSVGGKSRRSFARKHDTILWYARGRDYAFYPDAIKVPRKGGSHMRVVTGEDGRPVQEKTDRRTGKVYRYPVDLGKIPEDWWTDIETLNRGDVERTGYPTQKPARLLERLMHATTRPGQRVLDHFAGSGTTGVVAQRGGRSFCLVDASEAAIDVAVARLRQQGQELAELGRPPPDLRVEAALRTCEGATAAMSG